jgi:predicted metal-dependent enzyme (double-stranded beta helix superfamily)
MAVSAHTMQQYKNQIVAGMEPSLQPLDDRFARYLATLNDLHDHGCVDIAAQVAKAMRKLLAECGWLPGEYCESDENCYRRHLLYTDPAGRFTVLALVWRPGQSTPVHGHTAWGAVGVYAGHPSVATYRNDDGSGAVASGEFSCCPGDVSYVQAGAAEPHRIFNASDDIAITIHTYGRDLSEDPASINILV